MKLATSAPIASGRGASLPCQRSQEENPCRVQRLAYPQASLSGQGKRAMDVAIRDSCTSRHLADETDRRDDMLGM